MTHTRLLSSTSDIRTLSERLSRCPEVVRFDSVEEPQSWTISNSLADLEKAFLKIIDEQLPVLARNDLTPAEVNELLLDIGEEFRHILYHIQNTEYFGYLIENTE